VYAGRGLLFFRAYRSGSGFEPWRSDGTTTGTFMIEEMRSGTNSSTPAAWCALDRDVIFSAASDTDTGLFVTQGGASDVTLVKTGFAIWGTESVAMGGQVYLAGSEVGDGGNKELWKTDGATSVRVADINPGTISSYPEDLVVIGSTLYFTANDGTHGVELWSSDGTGSGTTLVQDIHPGVLSSSLDDLTAVGDRLFMQADDGVHGGELWVVETGVPSVIDIRPGVNGGGAGGITAVGDLAYFRSLGDGAVTTGAELWRSDGTPGGTFMVKEIGPGSQPGYIDLITDVDGTVFFFIADDGVHGSELWRSDGTETGTWMVRDINPSGDGLTGGASDIVEAGGAVYFSANDGANGFELWRSDGTALGTQMVADINPSGNGYPSNLTVVDHQLLFTATDPTHGSELWALDVCVFCDGFESGDCSRWSSPCP
jgi:ELWxxDGT repeat protein